MPSEKWGGSRPNTGGQRPGSGRPKIDDPDKASKRLLVRLTPGQYEALERLAKENGVKVPSLVRGWIDEKI